MVGLEASVQGQAQLQASVGEQPLSLAQPANFQVNVDAAGNNIARDAANEPSLAVDPNNPERLVVGWRQFNSITSDARFGGWSSSTNGGLTWQAQRVLQTNAFRSDPVLVGSSLGQFYYLSVQKEPYRSDLWQSATDPVRWQIVGPALGGDKPWITVDPTSGPGGGNLYEAWSPVDNTYGNRIFSRSTDGGLTWSDPIAVPAEPYWGTLAVGPDGELYIAGWNGSSFWISRSTNAPNASAVVKFELTRQVNLGGQISVSNPQLNPEGLTGQVWVAADRSEQRTRGNVYIVCSVATAGNRIQVMFSRSTDRGRTWSPPQLINDGSGPANAAHWFGTLDVAPNGRIDVCWYDTRSSPDQSLSQLYFSNSTDGGLSWSANRALSVPFDHTVGYPVQRKIGDYIQMVSLTDRTYIAYTATFNGEEDIFLRRLDYPVARVTRVSPPGLELSWSAVVGSTYEIQVKDRLDAPWTTLGTPILAVQSSMSVVETIEANAPRRFYRVLLLP